jgi:hypothetical protein
MITGRTGGMVSTLRVLPFLRIQPFLPILP